jgi:hypothetical protein
MAIAHFASDPEFKGCRIEETTVHAYQAAIAASQRLPARRNVRVAPAETN